MSFHDANEGSGQPSPPGWGAVVLSGGFSRRMGKDKAWLDFHGVHLLNQVCRVILSFMPDTQVLTVARPQQTLPPLESGVIRVDDLPGRAGGGPLVGLARGLDALEHKDCDFAYLLSCDAALLSEKHLAFLKDRILAGQDEAVLPLDDQGHAQPLLSVVRVAPCALRAQRLLAEGEARAQKLFDFEKVERIEADTLPDLNVLRACNTAKQWHEILRIGTPR